MLAQALAAIKMIARENLLKFITSFVLHADAACLHRAFEDVNPHHACQGEAAAQDCHGAPVAIVGLEASNE